MSGLMERFQKKQPSETNSLENFKKLSVDEILYKEARNTVQASFKDKKNKSFARKAF